MIKVRVLVSGIGILLLLALVMIGSVGGQDNESGSPLSTRVIVQPGDTIQQMSGLLVPYTLDDLILHSDAIVIGRVTDILPSKRGVLPGDISIIYTDVIVQIDRYLYGEPKSERIAIQVWGGRIGDTAMVAEDEAVFTVGEDIVAFLFRPPYELGPIPNVIETLSYYRVTGTCMGKFAYQETGLVDNGMVKDFPGQVVAISAIENKVAEIKG